MKFIKSYTKTYLNSFQDVTNVKFLRSGSEFFDALIKVIDEAKEVLHLQTYIFDNDTAGMMVLKALFKAAKRGVKIYVVVDGFGSNKLSSEYIDKLKAAGIYIRVFSIVSPFKTLRFSRRLHHKVVVADTHIALVGGINIADKYYLTQETEPWLDFALLIKGKEACEKLDKICCQIVEKKYRSKLISTHTHHAKSTTDHGRISIRQSDWLRNKRQIYKSYLLAIYNAEKSIVIFASYFLPGRRMKKALEFASKKGVKIIVVLPGISDIPLALNATYYLYNWLHKNNIRIFEWKKSVLHAKIAIVDDNWMTVGSFNLNHLSAYSSVELNIDVIKPSLVIHTRQELEKIMAYGCEEIDKNRKRPILTKVREFMAYHLGRAMIQTITFFPDFKNFYSRMVD